MEGFPRFPLCNSSATKNNRKRSFFSPKQMYGFGFSSSSCTFLGGMKWVGSGRVGSDLDKGRDEVG